MENTIIQGFFKVLCLAILGMSPINSTAQLIDYSRWSQDEKENKSLALINEATYVVEAKIEDFKFFYADDERTIYTDLTVKINHWYKGEGEDIIHIIRKGGHIGDDDQLGTSVPIPYTPMGQTYILLLNNHTSEKAYSFSKVSHTVVARSVDDFYMAGFHGLLFNENKDFNQFIVRADNIKIPRKKRCKFSKIFRKSSNGNR